MFDVCHSLYSVDYGRVRHLFVCMLIIVIFTFVFDAMEIIDVLFKDAPLRDRLSDRAIVIYVSGVATFLSFCISRHQIEECHLHIEVWNGVVAVSVFLSAFEEEEYVVRVVGRVQDLVKSRSFLVKDVPDHWIWNDEKVRAHKFVIFVEVPKADHCEPLAPHSGFSRVGLSCGVFFGFGVHFDVDAGHRVDFFIQISVFVKCGFLFIYSRIVAISKIR